MQQDANDDDDNNDDNNHDNNDYDDNDDDDNDDVSVFARMTLHAYSAHCALEASPLSHADHIIIIHQHQHQHHTSASWHDS